MAAAVGDIGGLLTLTLVVSVGLVDASAGDLLDLQTFVAIYRHRCAPAAGHAWLAADASLLDDCAGTACDAYHACAAQLEGGDVFCLKVSDECAALYDKECDPEMPKLKFHLVKKVRSKKEREPRGWSKGSAAKPYDQSHKDECRDASAHCCYWASLGECDSNPFWMRPNCQQACGTCGCTVDKANECKVNLGTCAASTSAPTYQPSAQTTTTVGRVTGYGNVVTTVAPTTSAQTDGYGCVDATDQCRYWADVGECERNPFWMQPNCQRSCNSCGKQVADVNTPPPIAGCHNENHLCQFWSTLGECDSNTLYMHKHCKLSCGKC